MRRPAIAAIGLLAAAAVAPAPSRASEPPWGERVGAAVASPGTAAVAAAPRIGPSNPLGAAFLGGLWFYRNVVSRVDGTRCGMYPTCSAYATQAVRAHGVVIGGFLAADRLLHESAARPPEYDTVVKFGVRRISDPVEKNDRHFRHATPPARVAPSPSVVAPGEEARPLAAADLDAAAARALGRGLAEAGRPYAAVTELERAAFLAADRREAADALLEAGGVAARVARAEEGAVRAADGEDRAERAWADADRLLDAAERAAVDAADPERARASEELRAAAFLSRGFAREAQARWMRIAEETTGDSAEAVEVRGRARLLAGWAAAEARLADGESGRSAARELAGSAGDPVGAQAITELRDAPISHRSAAVAMGLSLALPGAGFVYAGHPLLGLGSFTLNGVFIAGIAASLRDRNPLLAGALLTLEIGWYLGGASGAAEAVLHDRDAARARWLPGARRRVFGGISPGGAWAAVLF